MQFDKKQLVKKSIDVTIRTYGNIGKGAGIVAKSSGARAIDAVVRYGPDFHDKYGTGNFASSGSKVVISNSVMAGRFGFKVARTLKGKFDLKYRVPAYARKKDRIWELKYGMNQKGEELYGGRFVKGINKLRGKEGQVYAPLSFVSDKRISQGYTLLDKRQEKIRASAQYALSRGISKKDLLLSAKGMASNQSRRFMNKIVQEADDSATEMVGNSFRGARYGAKGVRGTRSLGKRVVRSAKDLRKFMAHPVQNTKFLVKNIISVIINILTTIVTSGGVIVTVVVAIAAIAIVIFSVMTIIMSLFTSSATQNDCEISGAGVGVCEETDMKDIAHASSITSPTSEQYKIFGYDKNGQGNLVDGTKTKFGIMKWDDLGFVYYEFGGEKYYCVAMASYYTNTVGDKFRITVEDGGKTKTFNVIICDQKADIHTRSGKNGAHCLSANGSMIEFYGDPKHLGVASTTNPFAGTTIGSMNRDLDDEHQFKGVVKNVEAVGNAGDSSNGSLGAACAGSEGDLEGGPQFDPKIWLDKNPYDPMSRGQCVWFAWARAYEIYGKSLWNPPANGIDCALKVVQTNPNDFVLSSEPKVGAIFSNYGFGASPTWGHVGIVVAINGDQVTIEESNVSGVPWNYKFPQSSGGYATSNGWHRRTVSKSQLKADRTVYANPKVSPKLASSGKALSKSSFKSKLKKTKDVSVDELKSLAKSKLGMDERSFYVALGWLAGDNLDGQDDYWSYLSACCPINAYKKQGGAGFVAQYTNDAWSNYRGYYTYGAYVNRANSTSANLRKIFYIALTNLDSRPTEANGMCPENGLSGRSINQAIYKTRAHSYETGREMWFGVWQ